METNMLTCLLFNEVCDVIYECPAPLGLINMFIKYKLKLAHACHAPIRFDTHSAKKFRSTDEQASYLLTVTF